MKMLLDENIPFRLYRDFSDEHEVYSVKYMNWSSYSNGELLKFMLAENFEALVTWDQNLGFQQNFKSYPVIVFVLQSLDNDYLSLKPLIPKIMEEIKRGVKPGPVIIKGG
jgi:hypothetical protein